jgi:hypothetical protein
MTLTKLPIIAWTEAEKVSAQALYKGGMTAPEVYLVLLSARVDALKAVLLAAREKLTLYRAQHSGEYIGGVEYVMLMDMIDRALGSKP